MSLNNRDRKKLRNYKDKNQKEKKPIRNIFVNKKKENKNTK